MHRERCDHCGQAVAPDPNRSFSFDDDPHPGATGYSGPSGSELDADHLLIGDNLGAAPDSAQVRRGRVLVAGLVLLVGAVVASILFAGRDASTDNASTAVDREVSGPGATEQSSGGADDSAPTGEDAGLASSTVQSAPLAVDAGAWFRSEVDDRPTGYAILYPGVDGLRLLNTEGFTTIDAQDAIGFQDAFGFLLFTDGQKTWGVNPKDPLDTYIVSRNYEIVDMGFDGAVAFANYDSEPVSVGISSFGGWGGGRDLPLGTETLAVQGLGLLVLPKTGGTFLLTGTGLELYSPDRIVAGSGNVVIAQRCDLELVCGLFLMKEGESAGVELPVGLGASLVPSPDGEWVLVSEAGAPSRIVHVVSGTEWALATGPVTVASWSPDSRLISWLSGGSLHVAFPEVRRQSTLPLPSIPSAPTMIVTAP